MIEVKEAPVFQAKALSQLRPVFLGTHLVEVEPGREAWADLYVYYSDRFEAHRVVVRYGDTRECEVLGMLDDEDCQNPALKCARYLAWEQGY